MTEKQNTANGPAEQGTEATSQEQSELSRIIQEFDRDNSDQVVKAFKAIEPVVDYVKEQKKKTEEQEKIDAQNRVNDIVKKAAEYVLDSEDLEVFKKTAKNPDRLARGYLEALAREDKEFEAAANDYFKTGNERDWNAALDRVKPSFVEEFGAMKSMKLRDDAEAAILATRGTQSTEPPDEGISVAEMFAMSDHDYDTYKAKELAKAAKRK